jgi:hypothetical protein
MGDKNPKHPLKKKKVVAKVDPAHQELTAGTEETTHKSKKHTY